MLVTYFLFVEKKLLRTSGFLPLSSQKNFMQHCPCLATSQPLLYHVQLLSTLIIAPDNMQATINWPCILPCFKAS